MKLFIYLLLCNNNTLYWYVKDKLIQLVNVCSNSARETN